jgi:hypothetical protein
MSHSADDGYRITWVARFSFSEKQWFHDAAYVDALVARLATTRWWPLLEVIGKDAPGTPIGDVAAVKQSLLGARGYWVLAKGPPQSTVYVDESQAYLKLDMAPGYLGFGAGASGATLAAMGGAALTEMIDVICDLISAWPGAITLTHATATPTGTFTYDRLTPPRVAIRPLHAVVDLVDAEGSEEDQLIARAGAPAGASRTERAGLVIIRCVEDPSDLPAVRKAAAAHERWIADAIHAPIDEEWEEGDG